MHPSSSFAKFEAADERNPPSLTSSRSASRLVSVRGGSIEAPCVASPASKPSNSAGSTFLLAWRRGNSGCCSWEASVVWAVLATVLVTLLLGLLAFAAASRASAAAAAAQTRNLTGHPQTALIVGGPKTTITTTMAHAPGNASNLQPPSPPIKPSSMLRRPSILLFGDSITEKSFQFGGWGARLADHLDRRVDIVNRGFGGYNSKWAAYMLPRIVSDLTAPPLLATVFFGANDAVSTTSLSARQGVPLADYSATLVLMVDYLRAHGCQRVVVLTPPPIHEPGRRAHHLSKGLTGDLELDRTNARTKTYALAALQAAAKANVPAVDLWDGLQDIPDWGTVYMSDGLHLTPHGNKRVFELLLTTLGSSYPEISPEVLPLHFPDYADIHMPDPALTFGPLDPALDFATALAKHGGAPPPAPPPPGQ